MIPILIACAAFLATFCGGLFALRFQDKLHLVLGFSAGAIIAVAFFDLLPESIELGIGNYEVGTILALAALGFVSYLLLDRILFFHEHASDGDSHDEGIFKKRGKLGAGSLSLHSFLDGVILGLSFQISPVVGAVVAAAVLTHDFSDGLNTVNLVLKNGGSKTTALKWLFVDALAPFFGVVVTMFFTLDEMALSPILALFAGFFLYIGATDLLPESHHRHPALLTTLMTVLGFAILYGVVQIAG